MKSSDVSHIGVYCQICGSPSHYADGCPVIGSDDNSRNQEDANYVGQNNQGAGPGYGPPTNRWDNPNRNNPNLVLQASESGASKLSIQTAARQCTVSAHEGNTTIRLSNRRIATPTSQGLSTIISIKISR
ncbi:unnamed protein product [Rhodiola kirilowii]